ncbi:YdcF family protein [Rhodococcus jostii]|uniref:YdcF family protein n=1 Tax=Rhodococcus jostii TaxID=132919 RepID=UPI001ED8DA79|nr:YdcF family protein [Rhodococcus jostii]
MDAIVVLGGENDGRVPYAVSLAEQGLARQVVISNPHDARDPSTNEGCATTDPRFTVTCVAPHPATTRGEAQFTRTLAVQNGWTSVLVVSWRYHLPRARYIFQRCFDGDLTMHAVPRSYDFSLAKWGYVYAYQTAGFVKAALQGRCL